MRCRSALFVTSTEENVRSIKTVREVNRYYFKIKEGESLIPDPEANDLPGESAAYEEIRATIADVLRFPHVCGDIQPWARCEFVVKRREWHTVMAIPVAALLRPN
jgi:hypothetical protein